MNMWISYSKYSTFKQCPLKYKLQYIDKIPTKPAPALFFGSTIHSCLEWLHRPGATQEPRSYGDLLKYLYSIWVPGEALAAYLAEENLDFDAWLDAGGCSLERAEQILEGYYKKHVPGDDDFDKVPMPAHAVEKKFMIKFDGDIVNGIIDRVDLLDDGSFEIIDYKTNKKAPNRLFDDNLEQLAIYKWAAEEGRVWPNGSFDPGDPLGFSPVKMAGLFFVDPSCNDKIFPDKELDVPAIKTKVRETIDKIKDQTALNKKGEAAFAPSANRLCDWCDFQELCPEKK